MSTRKVLAPYCPRYHRAVQVMGPRWSPEIIRALLAGASRFGEVRDAIPGISDRMVAERLRTFEDEGIVVRTVVPERPPRVDYGLTEKGRALASVVAAVAAWADDWIPDEDC